MPLHNHSNLGEVLSAPYKEGVIEALYFENEETPDDRWDYAQVDVDGGTAIIPIFYHCQPPAPNNLRINGAIQDCSTAFAVGDQVIVRFEIREDGSEHAAAVVGHVGGPKKCQCCIGTVEEGTIENWTSLGMDYPSITDRVECIYLEGLRLALIERAITAEVGYESIENTIAPYLLPDEGEPWFLAFVMIRNQIIGKFIIHTINYENKEEFEFWTLQLILEELEQEEVPLPGCTDMAAWVKQQYAILNLLRWVEEDVEIIPISSEAQSVVHAHRTGIFTISPSYGYSYSTWYKENGERVYLENYSTSKKEELPSSSITGIPEWQTYDFRQSKLEVRSPEEGNGGGNQLRVSYTKQFNFGENGGLQYDFDEGTYLIRNSIKFKLVGIFNQAADFNFFYKFGEYTEETGSDEINMNYRDTRTSLWYDPIPHTKIIYRRRTSPFDENVLKDTEKSCSVEASEEEQEREFKDLFPEVEEYNNSPVEPPGSKNDFPQGGGTGVNVYYTIRESYGGINAINIDVKGIKKPRYNFRDW